MTERHEHRFEENDEPGLLAARIETQARAREAMIEAGMTAAQADALVNHASEAGRAISEGKPLPPPPNLREPECSENHAQCRMALASVYGDVRMLTRERDDWIATATQRREALRQIMAPAKRILARLHNAEDTIHGDDVMALESAIERGELNA